MSVLKKLREESGLTQASLAEKAGLSLRTIQRIEACNKVPKGHTLRVLSQEFKLKPAAFQQLYISKNGTKESEKFSIKLINLSVLAFFLFPFGNLIVPIVVWRKKRQSERVNEVGRKIINLQIFWTLALCFALSVSPFINTNIWPSFPLILVVLFVALALNLLIVCFTAKAIQKDNIDFLNLPIRLI